MTLHQIYPDLNVKRLLGGRGTIHVIAVHGLDFKDARGKCSDSSWRQSPNGPLNEGWLKTFFQHSQYDVRLFLYEYDSVRVFCSKSMEFQDEATGLLKQMCKSRPCPDAPIIFLGHGFGGLLIKQALVSSVMDPRFSEIKRATSGLLFFGTPHSEINQWHPRWFERITSKLFRINTIQRLPDFGLPLAIRAHFRHQVEDYSFVSFYSNTDQIVPVLSAVLGLPGNRETQVRLLGNREDLCCFPISSDNYKKVTRNLEILCELTIQKISRRKF